MKRLELTARPQVNLIKDPNCTEQMIAMTMKLSRILNYQRQNYNFIHWGYNGKFLVGI